MIAALEPVILNMGYSSALVPHVFDAVYENALKIATAADKEPVIMVIISTVANSYGYSNCQCLSSIGEPGHAECESHSLGVEECISNSNCHWGPVESEQCQDMVKNYNNPNTT